MLDLMKIVVCGISNEYFSFLHSVWMVFDQPIQHRFVDTDTGRYKRTHMLTVQCTVYTVYSRNVSKSRHQ